MFQVIVNWKDVRSISLNVAGQCFIPYGIDSLSLYNNVRMYYVWWSVFVHTCSHTSAIV